MVDLLDHVSWVLDGPADQCERSIRLEECHLAQQLEQCQPASDAGSLKLCGKWNPQRLDEGCSATLVLSNLPVDSTVVDEHMLQRLAVGGLVHAFQVPGGRARRPVDGRFGEDDVP